MANQLTQVGQPERNPPPIPTRVGRWWTAEGVARLHLRGVAELVTAVAMLLGAVAHLLAVLRQKKRSSKKFSHKITMGSITPRLKPGACDGNIAGLSV